MRPFRSLDEKLVVTRGYLVAMIGMLMMMTGVGIATNVIWYGGVAMFAGGAVWCVGCIAMLISFRHLIAGYTVIDEIGAEKAE